MPDFLGVLADGAVGGEYAGHGGVDDSHAVPLVAIGVVRVDTALSHGVGAEVLQDEVGIAHVAVVADEQAVVQILQGAGSVGHHGAVDHLGQGQTQLRVGLEDGHGVVVALAVEPAFTIVAALAVEVALAIKATLLTIETALSALLTVEAALLAEVALTTETALAVVEVSLGAEFALSAVALGELIVACEIGIVGASFLEMLALATLTTGGGEDSIVVAPCCSCTFVFCEGFVALVVAHLRVCPHG